VKKTRKTYLISRKLEESAKAVFSYKQLSLIAEIPTEQVRVYASRLVQQGFAKRLLRGYISLTEDPFIISTQLVEPSYISFTAALYLREKLQQAPFVVECVTPVNSRRIKEPAIIYHKIDGRLFFGYERMPRYRSYIFVAQPEKALLDMVYYGRLYGNLEIDLDKDRLLAFGSRYSLLNSGRARRVVAWVKKHA
jgi:predicted transcriptional regulator of viral defense system